MFESTNARRSDRSATLPSGVDLRDIANELEALNGFGKPRFSADGTEFKVYCPLHQFDHPTPPRTPDMYIKLKDDGSVFFGCSSSGCGDWKLLKHALLDAGVPPRLVRGTTGSAHALLQRGASTAVAGFPRKDGRPELTGEQACAESEVFARTVDLLTKRFARPAFRELQERGVTESVIAQWGIGYDRGRDAVTVPIIDAKGDVLNVAYLHRGVKGFSQVSGFGSPTRLWGIADLGIDNSAPVAWCSGFYDALVARALGLVAVTPTQGEGNLPRAQDVGALRGRKIVIVADLDEPGRRAADKVYAALVASDCAAQVSVLELPGLTGDKRSKDLTDWWRMLHEAGSSTTTIADELRGLVARSLASVERARFKALEPADWWASPPPMEWLVDRIWPAESFGPLGGPKKSMKSYTAMAIAIALASGRPAFGHSEFTVPRARTVVYITGEGGLRLARGRLRRIAEAHGIRDWRELDLVLVDDREPLDSRVFRSAIERLCERYDPALVIVDPLYAFHGRDVEVTNLYDRGAMLQSLSTQFTRNGVGLIVPDHFNKTGSKQLDLDSLAQAGTAAWADSWILQVPTHAEMASGLISVNADFGSREGYSFSYAIDWHLGAFDSGTGEHTGEITWTVRSRDSNDQAQRSNLRIEDQILDYVGEHPEGVTMTDALAAKDAEGQAYIYGKSETKRALWKELGSTGLLIDAETKGPARKGKPVVRREGKLRLRGSGRSTSSAPAEGGQERITS